MEDEPTLQQHIRLADLEKIGQLLDRKPGRQSWLSLMQNEFTDIYVRGSKKSSEFSKQSSPGTALMRDLRDRSVTVRRLFDVLKKVDLREALPLLRSSGECACVTVHELSGA